MYVWQTLNIAEVCGQDVLHVLEYKLKDESSCDTHAPATSPKSHILAP